MMTPLRLAIAGLGTVGTGLLDLLQTQSDVLKKRTKQSFAVCAVSARNRDKHCDKPYVSEASWYSSPQALAQDGEYDVFIEVIGGAKDPAYSAVKAALERGKHVITANKALLSSHGVELARLAEAKGVALAFEAAIGGGMPAVKVLRESLAGDTVRQISGILNGTCNFILSQMSDHGYSFQEALKCAQEKGYAEQDPTFDIDGLDTAHKLSLLSTLAFGVPPSLEHMHIEGIRELLREDIEFVGELGYTLKLLGVAHYKDGRLSQKVSPFLVRQGAALAAVSGVNNALFVESVYAGQTTVSGQGAGGYPTALSLLSDLCDIARGSVFSAFSVDAQTLEYTHPPSFPAPEARTSYYIGFHILHHQKAQHFIEQFFEEEGIIVARSVQRLCDRNTRLRCGFLLEPTQTPHLEKILDGLRISEHITGEVRRFAVFGEV